uniref:RxLR effector candidate protein n=1 Tax=Hyaloperonospora arabidopsidis (strain Emoy2) TaxID=559515 RepID=M4BE31_HYAAE
MASVIGEKRLAAFSFWIRYENDHKDLADRLQQVLSMRYPGNVHLVADLALDANVSPDEVFFMMPITEEILAGGIRKDEQTWLEMYHMF